MGCVVTRADWDRFRGDRRAAWRLHNLGINQPHHGLSAVRLALYGGKGDMVMDGDAFVTPEWEDSYIPRR